MALPDGDGADAAVLAALLDRGAEGMTIFELRNQVAADIDAIEGALERLKARDLIEIEHTDDRATIRPTDAAREFAGELADEPSWLEQIRERLPF